MADGSPYTIQAVIAVLQVREQGELRDVSLPFPSVAVCIRQEIVC